MIERAGPAVLLASACLFCNRHETLPPALCQSADDCVGGEDCVHGKCLYTQDLILKVHLAGIHSRQAAGDLVVEAKRCREAGATTICDGEALVLRYKSPGIPEQVKFGGVARGTYIVTACIDADGNGACNASDVGKRDSVKSVDIPDNGKPAIAFVMILKYKLQE